MLLLLVFLTAFLGAPVVSILPALVKVVFHRDAASYSFLLSAFGAGAVLAAVCIAFFDRGRWPRKLSLLSLTVLGVTQAVLPFSGHFPLSIAIVFIGGLLFVGTMVRLGTAILQSTPDEFRGRVTAFQQILFRSGQPLGALVAGIAGNWFGIRLSFCAFGALLVAFMVVFVLRRGNRRHAEMWGR